jgi:3-hydroxymyristoyl/3-hydroxydecanoyl-(acyl carrier protein) dehydratase
MDFLNRLPHRFPFVFLDRVVEIKENHKAVCLKMLTASESIFHNKKCDNLIVPWTIIIEAMAQTSGLILGKKKSEAVIAELKNISIHGNALPGDCIKIISEKIIHFDRLHYFEAQALIEEKIIIKGDIILAEI